MTTAFHDIVMRSYSLRHSNFNVTVAHKSSKEVRVSDNRTNTDRFVTLGSRHVKTKQLRKGVRWPVRKGNFRD